MMQLRRRGETAICQAKEAGRGGQGGDGVDNEAEARQYVVQDPLSQRGSTKEARRGGGMPGVTKEAGQGGQ